MKAHVEPSNNNNSLKMSNANHDGKVHKAKHHQHSSPYKEEESAEIMAYLNKLQELVPFMPKDKKLSKLEVITCVIDYIQDLSETLGLPPSPSSLESSSCDEDDHDDSHDEVDEEDYEMKEDRPEDVGSSKVTQFSLNNNNQKDSYLPLKEQQSVPAVSNRQPLSVISNPENTTFLEGSQ